MEVARRSADPQAMSLAHLAMFTVDIYSPDVDMTHIDEARRWSRLADDPDLPSNVWSLWVNRLLVNGQVAAEADALSQAIREGLEQGLIGHPLWFGAILALQLIDLGRFHDAADTVREVLGFPGQFRGILLVRLAAGTLAVRTGDLAAAALHFAVAQEKMPDAETQPGIPAAALYAEHLVAQQQPARAFDMLERVLPIHLPDPELVDQILLWAARAAAAAATERRRPRRPPWRREDRSPATATGRARRLPPRATKTDPVHEALTALTAAERTDVDGTPDPDAWQRAATLARTADLAWEAALADLRTATALSVTAAARAMVGDPLPAPTGSRSPRVLCHSPRPARKLALTTGVPLTEPGDVSLGRGAPNRLNALTPREREILTHLVAGRTYAEIAAELFISEKTVSVHVSNLLRKTGTRSRRREVAALALRLGEVAAEA